MECDDVLDILDERLSVFESELYICQPYHEAYAILDDEMVLENLLFVVAKDGGLVVRVEDKLDHIFDGKNLVVIERPFKRSQLKIRMV